MNVPSAPTSVSSSSARSTPVPPPSSNKPLGQSASLTSLTKLGDQELQQKGPNELVRIIRHLEDELKSFLNEHNAIMKDFNRRNQILLLEIRNLKEINQNMQDDNQELRELCLFLDDDRRKGRKLAKEWQRFGRYTSSVMRSEVSLYQEKLKDLETKQNELISDNIDLKELCLYLDQERLRFTQMRDEGDGSSNSTNAGNEETLNGNDLAPEELLSEALSESRDTTTEYIQLLEQKIKHLEEEKILLAQVFDKVEGNSADGYISEKAADLGPSPITDREYARRERPQGTQFSEGTSLTPPVRGTSPSKPEAVVHAMKVLEVHEQLERPHTAVGEENLDDKEKAIVREMCNVVWRKLGDVGTERGSENSTPHPVYENLNSGRRSAPLSQAHQTISPNSKPSSLTLPPPPPPQIHAKGEQSHPLEPPPLGYRSISRSDLQHAQSKASIPQPIHSSQYLVQDRRQHPHHSTSSDQSLAHLTKYDKTAAGPASANQQPGYNQHSVVSQGHPQQNYPPQNSHLYQYSQRQRSDHPKSSASASSLNTSRSPPSQTSVSHRTANPLTFSQTAASSKALLHDYQNYPSPGEPHYQPTRASSATYMNTAVPQQTSGPPHAKQSYLQYSDRRASYLEATNSREGRPLSGYREDLGTERDIRNYYNQDYPR
ncbi:hypothetical protein CHS0354_038951 [Potamilus streckersoni]|uniref:Coiled-coil domain-containing protein 85C n=1 Tax=Potamilus streckersoni TaxID=2493646 RepID=A0AAE0S176_9BIVA|nr:hypothetical protein CHS0354_038951 [Potamilus streckersoni]